jgi:hypothetical protein
MEEATILTGTVAILVLMMRRAGQLIRELEWALGQISRWEMSRATLRTNTARFYLVKHMECLSGFVPAPICATICQLWFPVQ